MVDFLIACDPRARRYGLAHDHACLPLLEAAGWRPDVRYERTGAAAARLGLAALRDLLAEARQFVDVRVSALWRDGAIESEALR